jgi:aminoglycoside phosphotransferase (APT) family kinase protein
VGVLQRDPDVTAATLTRWLGERAGVDEPRVSNVSIPAATGWSNETIFCEATWSTDRESVTRRLVVRVAPSRYRVFPDDTFTRQYEVMRGLARQGVVPVPDAHWLERDPAWFGQPFWVMDRVDGDIPSDTPPYAEVGWLHDAAPDEQERAWYSGIEAMASVHRVDIDSLRLPAGTYQSVRDTVGHHLDHYERFLAWAEDGTPHPLARRALELLRRERPPEPRGGPRLVWGDARLSNLVFRHFEVVAVLDWEMSSIGDPLLDLGWWAFADEALSMGAGGARLPGFPPVAGTIEAWERATGCSASAFEYYELFAGVRFTVIMLRMGKLLADIGLVPAQFAYDNLVSRALARVLDRV